MTTAQLCQMRLLCSHWCGVVHQSTGVIARQALAQEHHGKCSLYKEIVPCLYPLFSMFGFRCLWLIIINYLSVQKDINQNKFT